ncbi:MAG TPA: flagellar type III secretion system pore protein FliP, partial [Dongiaceae bacterium]|nr:flagellar type III secretion system pore protein FliP [Dongiaceae bacterium]
MGGSAPIGARARKSAIVEAAALHHPPSQPSPTRRRRPTFVGGGEGVLLSGVVRWGCPALLFALLCLLPLAASAQSVTVNLGDAAGTGGSSTSRILQIIALLTVLSLAPGILIMVTSFTRIVVVLSLLRSALGGQQTPPNMVMVSLAMFLTAFVMAPTFQKSYDDGIAPLMAEQISEQDAFTRTTAPFKIFMLSQVREKDLGLFMDMAGTEPAATPEDTPLQILIPAFMVSELRRAFEIGFLLFVPFL